MGGSKAVIAVAVALWLVVVGTVVWAQGADRDACVDACEQAKTRCVEACGAHENPVECDEGCQNTAEACRLQCG